MHETIEPSFSELTSIHLGGTALAMLEPESVDDLPALAWRARTLGGEMFFLGRGTNLLAPDVELPLVLVRLARLDQIGCVGTAGGFTLVYAGAGAPLARLLRFCLKNGLSGLEGLMGIPGSVGGACAMNAGSFGVETCQRIHALKVWDGTSLKPICRDKIFFGYRTLKLAGYADLPLICGAIFALTACDKSVILQRMNLNYIKKKSRQPLGVWSAGCAFRNPPEGPSAGKLLEEAGFRGRRLGGMVFSERHANFLVNEGNGAASEALELLELGRNAVFSATGILLEPEIRILPWKLP